MDRTLIIATLKRQKTELVNKNHQLMAKLKIAEAQIHNNFIGNLTVTDQSKPWSGNSENVVCSKRIKELESLVETSDLKVKTLKDQLRSEQVEKETGLQKIKELNSLVEATEKKLLNMQEDLQENVELIEKLKTAKDQLHNNFIGNLTITDLSKLWSRNSEDVVCSERIKELESLVENSDLQVNSLEDQLRSEQVEKETCLQKIKELKSLVEATEKKLLNVQEDSQHKVQRMEEDIKLLIVKSIKLQELALMSDSHKARIREDERKAQKKQEKTEKEQREMEQKERERQEKIVKYKREKDLKEREKQAKIEKYQRVEELKDKMIEERLAEEEREMELRGSKKQEKIEKYKREKDLKDKKKQEKIEKEKTEKELKEKKKQEKIENEKKEQELKEKKQQEKIENEKREQELKEKKAIERALFLSTIVRM